MDKKPRRSGLLERAADALDLPADALAGLPRIELIGDRELRMENHRGILAYGDDEIRISGGRLVIRVVGEGLKLKAMNGSELLITGRLRAVELE